MADQGRTASSSAKKPDNGQFGEVFDLVKAYATQETIGPLKGIGRKIAWGLSGAIALSMGLFFISLGLLRLVQVKLPRLARGAWSWAPYGIVFVFCVLVTAFALSRISKIEKELN
ncbi:unannotated protein [freshwater metagenome]|uniref:Unannotated protein n=1 Tax=freshwater metagenome TaxID=449393 RepID=A0A6J7FXP0_9ZZZZ|nr:hypothetical protein [Actinomycetota bacterium]